MDLALRTRNITKEHRDRILSRIHPKNIFLGHFTPGRKGYKIKCADCGSIKMKASTGIRERCSCDKMSSSRFDDDFFKKKLNKNLTFLRRLGKRFVCTCNLCGKQLNKWSDSLSSPCRCVFSLKEDFVKKTLEKEGYNLLSSFKSSSFKMNTRCPNGHEWSVKWGDFYTGYRCGECGRLKNEKKCKEIIESITEKKFKKIKPKWLLNPKTGGRMEIDCFNEDLRIGLEYNGEQHYRPISWYGGEKSFKKTKQRDALKKKLCKKNNIDLIVVPYLIKNKRFFIEKKLKKILESRKYDPKR